MVDTTIRLRIKTKKLMDKRRIYPRESYNSIVERLLLSTKQDLKKLLEKQNLEKIEKSKDTLMEDESKKIIMGKKEDKIEEED